MTVGPHAALVLSAGRPLADAAWLPGRLLRATLFLTLLVTPLVFIEPSPYEGMAVLLLFACIVAKVTLDRTLVPLILLLVLWKGGLLIALLPVAHDTTAVTYVAVSIYLGLTAIVFAAIATEHSEERLSLLRTAYILAAFGAALVGILGYFGVFAPDLMLYAGRVRATFKDPNVFGPFLVLPLLFLIQLVIFRGARLRYLLAGGVILAGLFLSFSRGAWAHFVFSALIMVTLMFATAASTRLRARIAALAIGVAAAALGLLALLLSLEAVTTMFEQRAALVQSYDVGSGGRFTTQMRAFWHIFDHPFGIGPLQYNRRFGLDPHNDYLNAFYSAGWIGGIAYPTLVLTTLYVGLRAVFVPTPWQPHLIAVLATYAGVVAEGFIIGTDHWRHYYLLLGLTWGLAAASANARRVRLPCDPR